MEESRKETRPEEQAQVRKLAGKPPDAKAPRSRAEQLVRLEGHIVASERQGFAAGRALGEIQRRGLYVQVATTWEQYLRERWHWTRAHAATLIIVARVERDVRDVPNEMSQRAAKRLAKLKTPEDRKACLREVIEATKSLRPSEERVAAAVAKKLGLPVKPRRKKSKVRLQFAWATIVPKKAYPDRRSLLQAIIDDARAEMAKLPAPPLAKAG